MTTSSLVQKIAGNLTEARALLKQLQDPSADSANSAAGPADSGQVASYPLPKPGELDMAVIELLKDPAVVIYGGQEVIQTYRALSRALSEEVLDSGDDRKTQQAAIRIKIAFDKAQDALGSLTVQTTDSAVRESLLTVQKNISITQTEAAGAFAAADIAVLLPKKKNIGFISKNVTSDENLARFRSVMAELDQYIPLLHQKEEATDAAITKFSVENVFRDLDAKVDAEIARILDSGRDITAAELTKFNNDRLEAGVKDQLGQMNDLMTELQTSFLGGRLRELEAAVVGDEDHKWPEHEKQLSGTLAARLKSYRDMTHHIKQSKLDHLKEVGKVLHRELQRRMKGKLDI